MVLSSVSVNIFEPVSGVLSFFFFFNDTATTEIYTLSLHDALPISSRCCGTSSRSARGGTRPRSGAGEIPRRSVRSEEHTSELQSRPHLVCRLLLEKKKHPYVCRILPCARYGAGPRRRVQVVGRSRR